MKRDNLRLCEVIEPANYEYRRGEYNTSGPENRKLAGAVQYYAYFHMWRVEADVVDAGILIGSHPAGQISHVSALIEKMDGRICCVDPECIRFIDVQDDDDLFTGALEGL